jgi:hypothetical protein
VTLANGQPGTPPTVYPPGQGPVIPLGGSGSITPYTLASIQANQGQQTQPTTGSSFTTNR